MIIKLPNGEEKELDNNISIEEKKKYVANSLKSSMNTYIVLGENSQLLIF